MRTGMYWVRPGGSLFRTASRSPIAASSSPSSCKRNHCNGYCQDYLHIKEEVYSFVSDEKLQMSVVLTFSLTFLLIEMACSGQLQR